MRHQNLQSDETAKPTLGERLIAALMAPIVLNVSILLLVGVLFRRSHAHDHILLAPFAHTSASLALFILLGLPALAGFMLGATRGLALLSHLLLINPAPEISIPKTLMAWGALLLIAYVVSKLIS